VSNIPGETQTLPLAIYTATQTPGGEGAAARLAAVSFTLAIMGLLGAELIARRMHRLLGPRLMLEVALQPGSGPASRWRPISPPPAMA